MKFKLSKKKKSFYGIKFFFILHYERKKHCRTSSEKVLGKVGNIFKVEGKGVGILDVLFLGLNLKEVWTNEDKNINDKLYDSGKKYQEL